MPGHSSLWGSITGPAFVCVLLLAGCSRCEPPQFRLNTEGRDRGEISLAQAEAITDTLARLFGTPDEPKVPEEANLRLGLLEMAAGPIGSDEQGHSWGIYRQHCTACHGTSGDGAGPTAALQNPYPRDFRTGVYKYTSTAGGAKPVWEDLERIISRGIRGTAMPSFARLPAQQINALAEYVEYLSIRGETELFLLQLVVDEDEYPVDLEEVIQDGLVPAVEAWADASKFIVDPPEPPPTGSPRQFAASIAQGYQLFSSKDARCVECHGPDGRGDGPQSQQLYDNWNKRKKGATPSETRKLAGRFLLPIQQLYPRNFTQGTFRGGQRPIDQYWRIHVGIKGTPMPPAGPAPGSAGVLAPEEIWHVVNYIRSCAAWASNTEP